MAAALIGLPVLEWAALTAHFDGSLLAQLERIGEAEPGAGTLALRRLRHLREMIHDVLAGRSEAGRRRWCEMATCGNAAKSKRHYERKRLVRRDVGAMQTRRRG